MSRPLTLEERVLRDLEGALAVAQREGGTRWRVRGWLLASLIAGASIPLRAAEEEWQPS